MIQLNLLPDIKLDYIKAQRSRRLIVSAASIVGVVSLALLILLLVADGLQKKHLNDVSRDINNQSRQLSEKPQIGKILTVQNQLESLTALHAAKPAASNLFSYLNQLTPAQVNITTFSTDFTLQTATITGTADALSTVNKYVDTLKFTTFTTDKISTKQPAFKNVVLTNFELSTGNKDTNQAATYTISLAYDKTIFDITQKTTLAVPSLTTTRAQIDQPTELFKATTQPAVRGGN